MISVNDPVNSKRTGRGIDPIWYIKSIRCSSFSRKRQQLQGVYNELLYTCLSSKIPGEIDITGWPESYKDGKQNMLIHCQRR